MTSWMHEINMEFSLSCLLGDEKIWSQIYFMFRHHWERELTEYSDSRNHINRRIMFYLSRSKDFINRLEGCKFVLANTWVRLFLINHRGWGRPAVMFAIQKELLYKGVLYGCIYYCVHYLFNKITTFLLSQMFLVLTLFRKSNSAWIGSDTVWSMVNSAHLWVCYPWTHTWMCHLRNCSLTRIIVTHSVYAMTVQNNGSERGEIFCFLNKLTAVCRRINTFNGEKGRHAVYTISMNFKHRERRR